MVRLLKSKLNNKKYFNNDDISDLSLRWKLTKISHNIRHFFLLDKILLLIIKKRKAFVNFSLKILLSFNFLSHRKVVIPQHLIKKVIYYEILFFDKYKIKY